MRVLVTGAAGQLGTDVVAHLSGGAGRAGLDVLAADRAALDITDRSQLGRVVEAWRPDVVVNCAAYTAVDRAEAEPAVAYALNAVAVGHLVEAADSVGAYLCHLSTDYVFDGTKASPYDERDQPNPASVYGASKWAGEQLVDTERHLVVRTSWVCGYHGANMVKTILRLAAEHPVLRFVADQSGHPTFTADLAGLLARLAAERRPGLYHATNQGAVSWFEFAQEVLRASGADPARVEPIATADLDPPRPAPRPANSVLDNRALRLAGIPLLRDFRAPLAELVRELA